MHGDEYEVLRAETRDVAFMGVSDEPILVTFSLGLGGTRIGGFEVKETTGIWSVFDTLKAVLPKGTTSIKLFKDGEAVSPKAGFRYSFLFEWHDNGSEAPFKLACPGDDFAVICGSSAVPFPTLLLGS